MSDRLTKKQKEINALMKSFVITIVIIILLIVGAWAAMNYMDNKKAAGDDAVAETDTEESRGPSVDGLYVADYSRNAMKQALMEMYPWELKVLFEGETFEFDNMLEARIDEVLSDAYGFSPKEEYTIAYDQAGAEKAAGEMAMAAGNRFNKSVSENEVIRYDEVSGNFVFSDSASVTEIEVNSLEKELKEALINGEFSKSIEAKGEVQSPEYKAEDFKVIGEFSTHTTSNNDRNTNVRIACESCNGKILWPGESFSYNETLGRRTEDKGYKPAPAYSNGEHVMEYGGGICQVSTTIYNAVIAANLQVDSRRGHTYVPTYVDPGCDAAVSYPEPEFKFTNDSNAPIGLKVTFADRTISVQIYGIPTLEEGVKRYLRSEKIGNIDPPMPTYVEDPNVVPGFEFIAKNGKSGSKWKTYVVLEKDGEVISDEYIHTTSYRGEGAVIHRNIAGIDPAILQQIAGGQ